MNNKIDELTRAIKDCDKNSKILSNLYQINFIDNDGKYFDLFECHYLFEEIKKFALNKLTEIESLIIQNKWDLMEDDFYDKKYIVLWNGKNESSITRILDRFDIDYSFTKGLSIQDTIIDIGDKIIVYVKDKDIKITVIKKNDK